MIKFKQILSGIICTAMISMCCFNCVSANEITDENVYTEEEALSVTKEVDELFERRSRYILEENETMVAYIDSQLSEYEVFTPSDEKLQILGIDLNGENDVMIRDMSQVMPRYLPELPEYNSGFMWTEREYSMMYNGVLYDIYELRESAKYNLNSKLIAVHNTTISANYKVGSNVFLKAALTVGTCVGGNYFGSLAVASLGLTIYDAVKDIANGIGPQTSIGTMSASYLNTSVNDLIFVFVKPNGSDDEDYIMAYSGNYISCDSTCTIPGIYVNGSNVIPQNSTVSTLITFYSEYYNGRSTKACSNYLVYKAQGNNPNLAFRYIMDYYSLNLLGSTYSYAMNRPYHIY